MTFLNLITGKFESVEVPIKTKSAIKQYRFCGTKTQQRYILKEELPISEKKVVVLIENLRVFLKPYEQASKSTQILVRRHKTEIGSTLSKANLFAHCFKDNQKNSNSQMHFFFLFGKNNWCAISIKTFDVYGHQLIPAEIININHHELCSLHKNRCLIGYICGFGGSNYDIERAHNKRSRNWCRVLFKQKLLMRKMSVPGRSSIYSKILL